MRIQGSLESHKKINPTKILDEAGSRVSRKEGPLCRHIHFCLVRPTADNSPVVPTYPGLLIQGSREIIKWEFYPTTSMAVFYAAIENEQICEKS